MAFGFGVGIQRIGSIGVGTLTELQAMTPAAGIRPTGFVYDDATPANNGVYAWSGSAWVRKRGLPDTLAVLTSVGGTANAITASAPAYVDPATVALLLLVPTATNTGAVTLNGTAVKDAAGNALAAGALTAGRSYLLQVASGSYRVLLNSLSLISDVSGLQAALDSKADAAATTAALALKAPLDSPALTGNPTAPTPSVGDNDTSIATTAFVATAIGDSQSIAYVWTATAGQTVFTGGTATPARAAAFPGKVYCAVKVGGRPLHQSEFSTSGLNLTLTFPVTLNEEVELIAQGARPAGALPAAGSITSNELAGGAVITPSIASDAVDNTKLANMANATFKGRTTAGAGDPEDMTVAQAKALLGIFGNISAWDVILEDRKALTNNGGAAVAGFQTRDLQTIVYNPFGFCISLTANQFVLVAGTYLCEWSAPAFAVDRHKTQFTNVTDAVAIAPGSNAFTSKASTAAQTDSHGSTVFTIAAGKSLSIAHYTEQAQAGNGLGVTCSVYGSETYTRVKLKRLA